MLIDSRHTEETGKQVAAASAIAVIVAGLTLGACASAVRLIRTPLMRPASFPEAAQICEVSYRETSYRLFHRMHGMAKDVAERITISFTDATGTETQRTE